MLETARLITPQGKTIELSPEMNRQIQERLDRQAKRLTPTKADQVIRETFGKYADADSLTEALLEERLAERLSEDAKVFRCHA